MTTETFKKAIQDIFWNKKTPYPQEDEAGSVLTFPKYNEAEQAALYVKRPEGNVLSFNGVDYELIEVPSPTFQLTDENYPDMMPTHEIKQFPYNSPAEYIYNSLNIAGKFYAYKRIKTN